MKDECKYRLPCGWCDRQNKKCEMTRTTAGIATLTTAEKIAVNETDSALSAISSAPKYCGGCDKTDGMCYTSNPPKVKCTVTGRFHFYDDICDLQGTITAKG